MKKFNIMLLLTIILFMISCNQTQTGIGSQSDHPSLFSWCGDKNYISPNNADTSEAINQSQGLQDNWWVNTSWYHIWVKSFYDSDGDGCGDINGVKAKLDYIQNSVGCDGIWLSPIFECYGKSKEIGVNMHGYDTKDYYAVNDYFGTEQDVIDLIKACHDRGMKIIFDFVPNHTGLNCQWFLDSASGKNNKKTWYLWSDTKLSWNPGMGTSETWFKNDTNGKYFYGAFGYQMPDLNYRNYEVREEMKNVVRYWLNKGFDGLRIDAARYVVEDKDVYSDADSNHDFFKELRIELNKYTSPKFMVGEVWISSSRETLNKYFGDNDEFNMVLDFDQGRNAIDCVSDKKDQLGSSMYCNISPAKSYGSFLSNHDEYTDRPGLTLGQDYRLVGQAQALNILRPDVPFIYYGNEIGQSNTSYDGDLRLRGPFKWDKAEDQSTIDYSPLAYTKYLLSIRKNYPDVFSSGKVIKLSSNSGTGYIGYILTDDTTSLLCIYNLTNKSIEQISFSGIKNYDLNNYSCLFGNTTPTLDTTTDTNIVLVNHVSARAVRVYLLGNVAAENIWNAELEFSSSAYKPTNDKTKDFYPSAQMFLRGTMNDWGGYEMTSISSGMWSYTWNCTASGKYEFKFCANDGMPWAASWGAKGGGNLTYSFSAGQHTIIFNETASANSSNGAIYQIDP